MEETTKRRFTSDSPSFEEIRRLKKPNQRSCHILLDSSLAHEIQELQGEIEKIKKRAESHKGSLADKSPETILENLEDQLRELEDRADEATVEFVFQDIGRKRYDDLLSENPATDEDKKIYRDAGGEGVLPYSLTDFPPKLIARCSVSPKISEEQAYEIFDEWSEGDLELLFNTAILACKEPTSFPKSRAATELTTVSQQNSTTALNGESPTPNS